jgi:transcriptional accessory protein Tex/SPT6
MDSYVCSSCTACTVGAQDIIAEMAAELPAAREKARSELWQHGMLMSQLSRSAKQARQARP